MRTQHSTRKGRASLPITLTVAFALAMAFTTTAFAQEEGRATNRMVEPEVKEEIRFGARANVGNAGIFPDLWEFSFGTQVYAEGGISAGIGAFALIPFMSIYFVPEMSLQYRKPILATVTGIPSKLLLTETAIDIPLMFRFRYREENLIYLGVGPLLGVVLTSYYENEGEEKLNEWREKIDYGIAFELGFRINENFSIDLRWLVSAASIGFTEFFKESFKGNNPPLELEGTSSLFQYQIGVNYTF
jgi:hypothetical protein